jgi:tetratricopeptide (TPR) repeat protein
LITENRLLDAINVKRPFQPKAPSKERQVRCLTLFIVVAIVLVVGACSRNAAQDAEELRKLGLAYAENGNYAEARVKFERLTILQPDDALAWQNLGAVYYKLGCLKDAKQALRKAIGLRPDVVSFWTDLGGLLYETQDFGEAEVAFSRAASLEPQNPNRWCDLGFVRLEQAKYHEALIAYQTALRLNPGLAKAHNDMGCVFFRQREYHTALEHYQRAVELKPDFIIAWYNYWNTCDKLGEAEKAGAAFKEIQKLSPELADIICQRKERESASPPK